MKKWLYDESGQGMVEYGLILALVAIAAVVVLGQLGEKIKEIFNSANEELKVPDKNSTNKGTKQ